MPPPPTAFSPQVVIEYGRRVGTHYVVGSARRAAECMIEGSWPTEGRGPAYRAAVKACLAALEGAGDVEARGKPSSPPRRKWASSCGRDGDAGAFVHPIKPVIVETDTIGLVRAVGSVREAAEMLLQGWPEVNGQAYMNAVQAVEAGRFPRTRAPGPTPEAAAPRGAARVSPDEPRAWRRHRPWRTKMPTSFAALMNALRAVSASRVPSSAARSAFGESWPPGYGRELERSSIRRGACVRG